MTLWHFWKSQCLFMFHVRICWHFNFHMSLSTHQFRTCEFLKFFLDHFSSLSELTYFTVFFLKWQRRFTSCSLSRRLNYILYSENVSRIHRRLKKFDLWLSFWVQCMTTYPYFREYVKWSSFTWHQISSKIMKLKINIFVYHLWHEQKSAS